MRQKEVTVLVIFNGELIKFLYRRAAFNIHGSTFRLLLRKHPGDPGFSKLQFGLDPKKALRSLDQG